MARQKRADIPDRVSGDRFNFTKEALEALPLPEDGKRFSFHDAKTEGLQLRVTSTGVKTFSILRRVKGGSPERITIGRFLDGNRGVTVEQARVKAAQINAELLQGKSASERLKVEKLESVTFGEALEEYVTKKRRSKDGQPLKERTKSDYVAMITPGKQRSDGSWTLDGDLFPLASMPLKKITGRDIRACYDAAMKRGVRRGTYAAQVMRAVLNWHGVKPEGNPLGKEVAGKDRITISSTKGNPQPIPPERLGAWWNAAGTVGDQELRGRAASGRWIKIDDPNIISGSKVIADFLKFRLLTGCRAVEVLGDRYGNDPIRVRDVDTKGARITLHDTKNRQNHIILLSRQALEIIERNCRGKTKADPVFSVVDPRKTLLAINRAAGIEKTSLRATFASVAEELVSSYTLKRMMNHANSGDVTGTHYIGKGESQLRAGWQAVADFIEEMAETTREASHG